MDHHLFLLGWLIFLAFLPFCNTEWTGLFAYPCSWTVLIIFNTLQYTSNAKSLTWSAHLCTDVLFCHCMLEDLAMRQDLKTKAKEVYSELSQCRYHGQYFWLVAVIPLFRRGGLLESTLRTGSELLLLNFDSKTESRLFWSTSGIVANAATNFRTNPASLRKDITCLIFLWVG